jgi:hypothetical protein
MLHSVGSKGVRTACVRYISQPLSQQANKLTSLEDEPNKRLGSATMTGRAPSFISSSSNTQKGGSYAEEVYHNELN